METATVFSLSKSKLAPIKHCEALGEEHRAGGLGLAILGLLDCEKLLDMLNIYSIILVSAL